MNRRRILVVAAAGLCAAVWTYACGDGATEPPTPPPDPPRPATVAVAPATVQFTALGATEQLTAEVRDQNGRVMEGVVVSWSSADTAVAAVDSAGLVTAIGGGATTVAATAGEVSGAAVVTVMQSAGSVVVSPPADTMAPDDTLRLVAEAFDENGHRVQGAEFTWSSSDASVATVDGSGLVTGVAEGTATITAAAGSARGTAEITVENPDRAALEVLYHATDGPNWVNNDNWLTDAPLTEWYGVATNRDGRVTWLHLAGRYRNNDPEATLHGLRGPIPAEVGNLSKLEHLILAHNDLSGAIPAELGWLANLKSLSLSGNQLSGPIPAELGNLAKLQELRITTNNLTGEIPPELGKLSELGSLQLDVNGLAGTIPVELGELANLQSLSLSNNELAGSIPSQLGNLAKLTSLDLGGNELTGTIPSELGDLADLTRLSLWGNELSGAVPAELSNLAKLTELSVVENNLSGPVPRAFLQLSRLENFWIRDNDICVPGTSGFLDWVQRIQRHDIDEYCNSGDVAALKALYDATGGRDWADASVWASDVAVEEWYGISTDSLGRVTTLDLTSNGLTGSLPSALGDLTQMTVLRIGDNQLGGRLPLSLTGLGLHEFRYAGTDLCVPARVSFQSWLSGVSSHQGTGVECDSLSDREILEALYHATGGVNWFTSANWLTNAPLGQWHGVWVDGQGQVTSLFLNDNNLTGSLPPELGDLGNLTELDLARNNLTGPIPAELGDLGNLTELDLARNGLTGPILAELGDLGNLTGLDLAGNNLAGPIPAELGDLGNLTELDLARNNLTGPIPVELGSLESLVSLSLRSNGLSGSLPPALGELASVEDLFLSDNDLSGPVPAEIGGMSGLQNLNLSRNAQLAGPLPTSLTALGRLDALRTGGTALCAPTDAAFQTWLEAIRTRWVALCTPGDRSTAYMTQAVQSREFPVPLVAGERALLRVFLRARQATSTGIPAVRARFYRGGRETHVEDIPGKSDPIPAEVDESSLSRSANAEIPGHVVQPGLEMVIEVDPDGTLDPALGVPRRIPEAGRLAVDVRTMPPFGLTLIPFVWTETQDSSIVELIRAMADDPENHEMLWATRTLLPVRNLTVAAHEPVLSESNNPWELFGRTIAIRTMEGGTGHYMGMLSQPVSGGAAGVAHRPGRSSFSIPNGLIMAHELGHNMSLGHAPCGHVADPDPLWPYSDGFIGAWGYDFRGAGSLIHPRSPDLMSYCFPKRVSDYHFTNALQYRLFDEGAAAVAPAATAARSLLVWGGVAADNVPYLEPAFVVDARPALPASTGEYRIVGRTAGAGELFSLSFAMPEVVDGDGSSFFAFVFPVRPGWKEHLASITVSGPGGSFTLDGGSDIPMAILRNPRTGQIRGILRDLASATQVAADAPGQAADPGLEVLFSRGLPGGDAWRR